MSSAEQRRLFGQLALDERWGPIEAVLATSYEFDADFFERDLMPALFELPGQGTKLQVSPARLEHRLAQLNGMVVLIDAHGCHHRPTSLRVEFKATRYAGKLHAKWLLIVHEKAVRLIVGSHNLTDSGWRRNLEISTAIIAEKGKLEHAELIRKAIMEAPEILKKWWGVDAQRVLTRARAVLDELGPGRPANGDQFAWSHPASPLLQQFMKAWPAGESVKRITLVSPFWSSEFRRQPVIELTNQLRQRGALSPDCVIRLITDQVPATRKPLLPEGLLQACAKAEGLRIEAAPYLAEIQKDDNPDAASAGMQRPFHAKFALIESDKTSLAYAGSANFTLDGWGFTGGPRTNIEAGLLMRRTGSAREELRQLIPAVHGEWLSLTGPRVEIDGQLEEEQTAESPWPEFLTDARLCPAPLAVEKLSLRLQFESPPPGIIEIMSYDDDVQRSLLQLQGVEAEPEYWIDLDANRLEKLLQTKMILVRWQAGERSIPLNVDDIARERLPIGDPGRGPQESDLIRYFQGMISFEAMFGEDETQNESSQASGTDPNLRSQVETSRIQSYQIREFVSALSGIRSYLSEATSREGAMRQALLGPASPVALADMIMKEVAVGHRSPVAAGFQLSELMLVLSELAGHADLKKWAIHHAVAEGKLSDRLKALKEIAPALRTGTFARYERMLNRLCDERKSKQ